MTDKQKQDAIETFQKSYCEVFIGNIRAAGTGINGLQEVCDTAVVVELSWVPGEMSQAINLLHRIGMAVRPGTD